MPPHFPSSLSRLVPAMAVMAALSPAAALADNAGATVTNLVSKQFVVSSNGESYHRVSHLANLVADVRVQVDTGAVGRVKSWKVWLGLETQDGESAEFPAFGKGKSYDVFQRPTSVSRIEHLIVPSAAWGEFVKGRCNALADDLRSQGLGDSAIFDRDRKLQLAVIGHIHADNNGAGSDTVWVGAVDWAARKKVEVVCKRWPGAAIPQASDSLAVAPSKVVNKGLSIYEQYGITGVCKIRLDGWITTDRKNATVKFRYRNQDGRLSKVWTVNTGESKTATFSHWYDIQDNGFSDGGIELAETGFVRMIGVSHDFRSDWAEYTMECVEGGPDTLVANEPPKLSMTVVEQGKVMVHGRLCPERLKLVGVLEGRGNFSGKMFFMGPAYLSPLRDYSITHGQKILFGADVDLNWDDVAPPNPQGPMGQWRRFTLKATNANDVVIAALPQKVHFAQCRAPLMNPSVQPPGGLTTEPPSEPRGQDGAKATPKRLQVSPQAPQPRQRLQPSVPLRVVPRPGT